MKLNDIIAATGDTLESIRAKLAEATYVGIDFGTSTTTVTRICIDEDTGRIVSRPLDVAQEDTLGTRTFDHLVPTAIAMMPDGHLIFGSGAKEAAVGSQRFAEGFNVWTGIKMRLGERACYPQSRMSRLNTPVPDIVIETPKDAAMLYFAYLKDAIDEAVKREHLPMDVRLSLTVPASFAPNQRAELCEAVQESGMEIKPDAILDEPNAAFIGIVGEHAADGGTAAFFQNGSPCQVLVFDYGAGTCDISLLKVTEDQTIQNLAISRFTAMGGRDIDEKIAAEYLYPDLIKDRSDDDIPVQSVRRNLIDKLLPVAERMKIALCEKFNDGYGGKAFQLAKEHGDDYAEASFSQKTKDFGLFENNALRLTAEQFASIMREFAEDPEEAFDNGRKSILEPLENVLGKVGFEKEDVDYVILVGGSCLNPFVKDIVEEYFPRSTTILLPRDPRTLVAEGAAFQSLVSNGFMDTFIQPITSEEISIRTPEGSVCVFPVSTPVPADWRTINGLYIDDDSALSGIFGIPFETSNGNQEIGVAKFAMEDLEEGCEVALSCSLSADKVLAYRIVANGRKFSGVLELPVSTDFVDENEKDYAQARNEVDRSALANRGVPTVASLVAAAKACRKLSRYEEEAQLYRQLMYVHRNAHFEFEAAKAFRDAHMRKEALAWSRKACKHNPNYLNNWYIIWDLSAVKGWDDQETFAWLERALATWPDDLDLKYVDMRCLKACGQVDKAKAVAEELCREWENEGVANLSNYSLARFLNIAEICGRRDLCSEIRARQRVLKEAGESDDATDCYASVRSRDLGDRLKGEN